MSISSPFMWLQGGLGDQGMQSLNFQGLGVTPWMQPRLDASMPGLQPEIYQAMTSAAFQEMRTMDPSKPLSQSLLQFQQTSNVPSAYASELQRQVLPQSQPQNTHLHNFHENQAPAPSQILQQLHRYHPYSDQRQQQQQLKNLPVQQQLPNVISPLSNFASAAQSQSPSMQALASHCQQQSFPEPIKNHISSSDVSPIQSLLGSFSQDGASQLLNLNGSNSIMSSGALLPKQITVEPQLPSAAAQCVLPQVENLGTSQSNVSELAPLPPFPGREHSAYQGAADPQSNLLFGINIDPSSLMLQNGMPNLRNIGNVNDSLSLPFSASNCGGATGTDFPLSSTMTTSSCVDESGFLQSSENVDQANTPTGTFVKVKLVSFLYIGGMPLFIYFMCIDIMFFFFHHLPKFKLQVIYIYITYLFQCRIGFLLF